MIIVDNYLSAVSRAWPPILRGNIILVCNDLNALCERSDLSLDVDGYLLPPPSTTHLTDDHNSLHSITENEEHAYAAGPLEITDTAYSYDAYAYYIAVITSPGNDTTIGKVEFYWHREEA